MRSFGKFWRDRRGISAIEFSLILPVLTSVLILGFDGWMMINQSQDMRTSVQTGARYYQIGGSDDADARTAALAAWVNKPAAGDVQVARACFCGATTNNCASSCASGTPSTYVTLTATSTFSGMIQSKALTETEVVRVN
jgi:Flp pilus assembly protein TadG